MTYSGFLSMPETAKTSISDTVREAVKKELDNVELTATYTPEQQSWTAVNALSSDDCGKFVCVMNFDDRIAEVCNQAGSRTVIGTIDSVNDVDSTEFILGTQVFVKESTTLVEGALLVSDQKLPHYGSVQVDDILRSSTIGRVVQVYDRSLYYDPEGNRKTVGEYELAKAKKLQFNPQGPVVARNPSSARVSTPTARVSLPSISRRPSASAQIPQSPRGLITRYRLVRYKPVC